MSQWVVTGLLEAGLPAVCIETRHMKAVLQDQQVKKSDRKDASGIAQMMRVGLYRAVNVKTLASQQEQMLLTSRKLLRDKLQNMENHHVAAIAPTLERSESLARRHTLYSRKQRVAAELADAGYV
jgi:hypothetical protein